MKPFLSIYTPTYKRPRLLSRCIASVMAQTIGNEQIQHYVVRDDIGIGIGGMFAAIADNAKHLIGEYVYILQDDDILAKPDVVQRLYDFAKGNGNPEVIIVQNTKRGMRLPLVWEDAPRVGMIDLGSYIVRRDVFTVNAHFFGRRYEGDFDFIETLWIRGYKFAWFRLLFAEAQALGLGRDEVGILNDEDALAPMARRELR